eukprot:CAMPEP_0197542074 /NCGR_PEP_ID=MMETSP1318-20131121/67511_1 /TAXON_ID=552666 /ORGANISM="Partenskyella glossopodia, Strain RCC365" /LENGTH=290 /DNA_ID=CAMNT_0043101315 /DNA_START=514 /DNA_END=1382 /DNA_ORIENTATION=+
MVLDWRVSVVGYRDGTEMILDVRIWHFWARSNKSTALKVVCSPKPWLNPPPAEHGKDPPDADLELAERLNVLVESERFRALLLHEDLEVVLEVLAYAGQFPHHIHSYRVQVRGLPDARHLQQMWRPYGPSSEYDFFLCANAQPLPPCIHHLYSSGPWLGAGAAVCAIICVCSSFCSISASVEQHALHHAVGLDFEVVCVQLFGLEVSAAGAPPHPVLNSHRHGAEALLLLAVVVRSARISRLHARLHERRIQRVLASSICGMQRPGPPSVLVFSSRPGLCPLEIRQAVLV